MFPRGRALTRSARGGPHGSRRALVVYLFAIVIPTLLLLFFGLEALRQQRRAVGRLAEANRMLVERAAADALEQRAGDLATSCLSDGRLAATVDTRPWSHGEQVRAARLALDDVARQHPIARHLFLIEDREIRVPRVGAAWPQSSDDILQAETGPAADGVRTAFGAAERLEAADRLSEALARYRDVRAACRSEALAGLASARVARCLDRLGRRAEAVAAYTEIITRFRGVYDLVARPYALDAAVELARLQPRKAVQLSILLHSLRVDLADGRWEVSPDEADYFLRGLGGGDLASAGQAYLRYLLSAQVLADALQSGALARSGSVQLVAAASTAAPRQFYYQSKADGLAVALDMDLDYVSGDLLAGVARDLRSAAPLRVADASRQGTRFRSAFRFWEVRAAPSPDVGLSVLRPGLVAAGALLVLGVLLLGVALLLRDITRQAATNQLRADLVGGVSHDLKTPLSVIRLFGETLASDPDVDRASRSWYYNVIVHESERLTSLIDQVLDFSRVERGARQYQMRTGSLADVVSQVLERYLPHLGHQGFSVEHRSDPDVPAVCFDEGAVSQAVLNLIDNAVKYSDDDRHLAVRVVRRGGEAAIEVEDHGAGIAAGDRERVFARFSRASQPASRASQPASRGSHGLGLYLVKHMADAHGARIELESTPGRGSLFRLVFPPAACHDEPAM
jgi:signal transduction histidine kinase